tara:strand:- start:316 stop:462 length:147 start_codon:yes stop_codon:yes gene_type:complete
MKEYYWEIIASGYIAADSLKEAKKTLKENSIGFVMDDEKWLEIKVRKG